MTGTSQAGFAWRKSSYSADNGNCVEVATLPPAWRKSSYSADNGSCVEVATLSAGRAVRDSKDPSAGVLTVQASAFAAFLRHVTGG